MKISAVCFDLGKVLIDFDWHHMLQRVALKSPLVPEEIGQSISGDSQVLGYEAGQITTAKFFTHLKKRLQYKGTAKELRTCFTEIFTPLPENIALAALLAPHYPLAIISNTNDAHITYAEATYSFFPLFPVRIYSHQVGAMKPAPRNFSARPSRARRSYRPAGDPFHRRSRDEHPGGRAARLADDPSSARREPARVPRQL